MGHCSFAVPNMWNIWALWKIHYLVFSSFPSCWEQHPSIVLGSGIRITLIFTPSGADAYADADPFGYRIWEWYSFSYNRTGRFCSHPYSCRFGVERNGSQGLLCLLFIISWEWINMNEPVKYFNYAGYIQCNTYMK